MRLEPDGVVAVAPRPVLERASADLAPEAGHLGPLLVDAGSRRPGDLAHPQGLSPVLHRQPATGSGVVREGGVAHGVQPRDRGGHRPSVTMRPSWHRTPLASSHSVRGRTPTASRTRSAETEVPSERWTTRPSWTALTSTPPRSRTPSSPSHCARRAPASGPSRACCGRGSLATSVTSWPVARSDAAASHPMKPDPTTTTDRASATADRSSCPWAHDRSSRTAGWSPPARGAAAASCPGPARTTRRTCSRRSPSAPTAAAGPGRRPRSPARARPPGRGRSRRPRAAARPPSPRRGGGPWTGPDGSTAGARRRSA